MRRPLLVLVPCVAACLVACGEPNQLTLSSAQARVDLTVEPFSFVVKNERGEPVLTSSTLGEGAYGRAAPTVDSPTFSSQIVPGWDDYRAGDGEWIRGGAAARLVERSARAAIVEWDVDSSTTMRVFFSVDGDEVRIRATTQLTEGGTRYSKTTLAFTLPNDEHFFGLGERFATFDHRGWSLYSWAEEGPLGQGENAPPAADNPYPAGPSMTYFPVPFFISNKGYGLHVNTGFRSELHLGSERDDAWRVAVNHTEVNLTVYLGTPVEVLDGFTEDTGRPIVPASWVWGPRRRISPDQTIDGGAEWALMRERKLPLTGIDDAVHFLPASSQLGREQELKSWVRTLHDHGFKVMNYNNPFVAKDHPNSRADFQFGAEQGYFVADSEGKPVEAFLISGAPLYVGMIDFTNPDASAWYRGLLQRSLEYGYDGWMHDFGEYVPRRARFADGRRGTEMHNLYPMLSAKEARLVLQAAKPDDHLFFVRAGYTGSQAFVPAVWGGDAETSFDETQGIPSTIRSGLNLALSGVPYWGSDGTGFKCLTQAMRDKEVYVRWLELEAVSPIMMDQNACSNPLERRSKWTLFSDDETQDVYRAMAGLHTRLEPYFVLLSHEAHRSGLPVMRPPFLFWPNEARTWSMDDTFFLGPALYAAPVLRRGVTQRTVWFPPGPRYVAWDDQRVYGPDSEVMVSAPLGRLPLFVVEGQLLPMLDEEVQTLAPAAVANVVTKASRADVLDVVVALSAGKDATLTLADGTTLTARRGTVDQGTGGYTPGEVRSCERCVATASRGDVQEVRLTTERASSSDATFEDLTLEVRGPVARRVRWQVWRLP